jgi:hypothetical protein
LKDFLSLASTFGTRQIPIRSLLLKIQEVLLKHQNQLSPLMIQNILILHAYAGGFSAEFTYEIYELIVRK